MPTGETETIFSSKIKYKGIFLFKDFYKFCYEWLNQEMGLDIIEDKYDEKISGNKKDIEIKWTGTKRVTDYFKWTVVVKFRILQLEEVEVIKDNLKISTNSGSVEVNARGDLQRDWQGKYDATAFRKFLRGIYDKWVIPARIEEYEDKLIGKTDEFLEQAKAYLDLEGRK